MKRYHHYIVAALLVTAMACSGGGGGSKPAPDGTGPTVDGPSGTVGTGGGDAPATATGGGGSKPASDDTGPTVDGLSGTVAGGGGSEPASGPATATGGGGGADSGAVAGGGEVNPLVPPVPPAPSPAPAPMVTIVSPPAGASFDLTAWPASIDLEGTADSETATLKWIVTDPSGVEIEVLQADSTKAEAMRKVPGVYVITLAATSDKGVVGSASRSITVKEPLPPEIQYQGLSDGGVYSVDGKYLLRSASMYGGISNSTYTWTLEKPVLSKNNLDIYGLVREIAYFTPDVAGDYTIKITATNMVGSSITKTIKVTIVALQKVRLTGLLDNFSPIYAMVKAASGYYVAHNSGLLYRRLTKAGWSPLLQSGDSVYSVLPVSDTEFYVGGDQKVMRRQFGVLTTHALSMSCSPSIRDLKMHQGVLYVSAVCGAGTQSYIWYLKNGEMVQLMGPDGVTPVQGRMAAFPDDLVIANNSIQPMYVIDKNHVVSMMAPDVPEDPSLPMTNITFGRCVADPGVDSGAGYVYCLGNLKAWPGELYKLTLKGGTLTAKERVADAVPGAAISLDVFEKKVYVATSDSKLYGHSAGVGWVNIPVFPVLPDPMTALLFPRDFAGATGKIFGLNDAETAWVDEKVGRELSAGAMAIAGGKIVVAGKMVEAPNSPAMITIDRKTKEVAWVAYPAGALPMIKLSGNDKGVMWGIAEGGDQRQLVHYDGNAWSVMPLDAGLGNSVLFAIGMSADGLSAIFVGDVNNKFQLIQTSDGKTMTPLTEVGNGQWIRRLRWTSGKLLVVGIGNVNGAGYSAGILESGTLTDLNLPAGLPSLNDGIIVGDEVYIAGDGGTMVSRKGIAPWKVENLGQAGLVVLVGDDPGSKIRVLAKDGKIYERAADGKWAVAITLNVGNESSADHMVTTDGDGLVTGAQEGQWIQRINYIGPAIAP